MTFDFDQPIDRTGTHAVKTDARFARGHVTPLWVADMDFAAPPCVGAAIAARAAHPIYGYTVVPQSLHEAVIDWHARRHDWPIEREWIVFVPGTLPAIALAIEALSAPGEGVVVQPPVYGPFAAIAQAQRRRVHANRLRETDGHYTLDEDDLARAAAAGARLLLLCSPHNPVGRVWTRRELDAVLAIAREHAMAVFADEVHGDLAYPGARHIPIGRLAGADERVISAVSPSKPFNVQGLPLTALVIPNPDVRQAVTGALAAHRLDNFDPFSLAAAQAAWNEGGPWLDALLAYLDGTRTALVEAVQTRLAPLRIVAPEASYLAWLDCRALGLDDADLERFFVERCHLGLNPGTDFGAAGSGFMRLNFASPRARILAALDAIGAAL